MKTPRAARRFLFADENVLTAMFARGSERARRDAEDAPEHGRKRAGALITQINRHGGDRHALGQTPDRFEQPRLLFPARKGDAVSCRNRRYSVRVLVFMSPASSAQTRRVDRSARIRSHNCARSGLSGSGRSSAHGGRRRISAISSFISRPSSPRSSYAVGSATARTTSSRNNGVTSSTTHDAGMPAPAVSFT